MKELIAVSSLVGIASVTGPVPKAPPRFSRRDKSGVPSFGPPVTSFGAVQTESGATKNIGLEANRSTTAEPQHSGHL